MVRADGNRVSCGLRINPEYSDVETDLYNPCAPGSRMGVTGDLLGDTLPEGIEGLHFHTLCESTSYDLERTLAEVAAIRGLTPKQAGILTRQNLTDGFLLGKSV